MNSLSKLGFIICSSALLIPTHGFAASPEGVGDCHLTDGNFAPGVEGGVQGWIGHPCPQPRPGNGGFFGSMQTLSEDGTTTFVVTPEGQHEAQDPFEHPPGTNFLMTVDSNLFDFNGEEMPNTQPSRLGDENYLLHDGPVTTREINKTSPSDDLDQLIDLMHADAENGEIQLTAVDMATRILEGMPIDDRDYSGFSMLHYTGPNRIKKVIPSCNDQVCEEGDEVTGGNVDINMIYWDQHIESDTAFIDPSEVQEVPWTVTYHVRILSGGIEDFSPMTMHFDRTPSGGRGPFHASMDQSYFPMLDEGKEYTIKIKESKGKYYNLTYTWGWRIHPPRVQVSENALKMGMSGEPGVGPKSLPQWEIDVFGENPKSNIFTRRKAIAQIGDLSPAKRMWNDLRFLRSAYFVLSMLNANKSEKSTQNADQMLTRIIQAYKERDLDALSNYEKDMGLFDADKTTQISSFKAMYQSMNNQHLKTGSPYAPWLTNITSDMQAAFLDWSDRTKLPAGIEADPDATITLLYVNNTIYGSRQGLTGEGSGLGAGSFKGTCNGCAHDWHVRPYNYKVTLYNADHFVHGYMNVDFGGSRGWENQFQETDPTTAFAEDIHSAPTVIQGDRTDIVNGEVVVSNGNRIEDSNILLDTTINEGKSNLAINQATGDRVYSDQQIFPINTGGTEEFLQESPRNSSDPDNGTPLLGSGCFFTFGRNYAWPNAGGPWGGIYVPAVAADGTPGMHKVEIEYNFEPSRRLKIYQFDPLHHDQAIYSLH
ncbi:MAG: hypothetical protein ACWA5R_11415 [bacterium]